jgi:thioesterase domain-containing protein
MLYTKFAEYLGPNQPIFGLQARGLLGTTDQAHRNVREMAADYINEIQSVQPTGPYQLCGFSMGGVLAFEMACQLRAAGEEVAFIGLLDSYSPGYPKPGTNVVQLKLSRIWDILSGHWINLSRGELPQKIEYLKNRSRNRIAKIQLVLFGWLFVALRIPMPQRIRVVYVKQFNEGATEKYVPGKYPGKITIFRAHRQPRGFIEDPYLGWEGHAEVIEIVETAGTHISIMQRHLGGLVNEIRLRLNLPGSAMESGEDGKSLDHTSHMKNLSTTNALPTK